ncbi:39S ribosomal protein L3, mitochondrial [Collichthys lucidus]|uniref:Large ribosomal subunit protein uL3m n=1 Tax=Collichthys lucidus TaxID=240159 RepID=A0A4U5VKX8_COLLU|nr:39S ribosomal protein L3, mitochondrial [Collichthys lucidus]
MAAWSCRVLLQRGARLVSLRAASESPAQLVGYGVRTVKTTTWFEEHLTEDNQEYMRKSMAEEYRRQTAEKLNPLKDEPWQRHEWTEGSRRVGLVALKLGMAPIWTTTGERHVVTMLQVQDCHVIKHLTKEEHDGHTAALLVGGKNVSPFHIWRVNTKYNVLYVHGSVPGHRNCLLKVRDTILPTKSSTLVNPPFPTYFTEEEGDLAEDLYDDELFIHTDPSLTLT